MRASCTVAARRPGGAAALCRRGGGWRPQSAVRHGSPAAVQSAAASASSQDEEVGPSASGRPEGVGAVPPPPALRGRLPRKHWNALALAYLGDSVWEVYVRRHFFYPPRAMADYHSRVKASVRAEAQDAIFRRLQGSGFLTEEEAQVLRWGRNATGTVPKRFAAAGLKTQAYRHATAVECLAGFLYLTDPRRLHQLMAFLHLDGPAAAEAAGDIGAWGSSIGSSWDGGEASSDEALAAGGGGGGPPER